MRIVTGTISHETNTFSNIPTDLEEFGKQGISLGSDALARFAGTNSIEAAYLDAARQHRFDLIPTVWASAIPGGVIPRDTLDFLLGKLLEGIRAAGRIDAVVLHLHGAAVATGIEDVEGFVLESVRRLVGPEVPVVSTLDLHANVTERMVRSADLLIGYDTYPHVDVYERGREVADRLMEILSGKIKPTAALEKPALMPPLQPMVTTMDTPMKALIDLAREIEKETGIISVSVFGGFPFSDIEPAGLGVLVYSDNDPGLAREKARAVVRRAWELREGWVYRAVPVREAVERAMKAPAGPIILADIADSGAGGTAGDGTEVLRVLLQLGARSAAVCSISDPEAIERCIAAGVGTVISMMVGGKRDKLHGEPVEITGKVRLIHEGSFIRKGPQKTGQVQTVGRAVVLEIGGIGGIELMLTEHRAHPNDLEYFRAFGIEPLDRKMLVLKSAAHFRAAFEPIAKEVIDVDAPGITSPDLARFPFQHIRRPIFPLDRFEEVVPEPDAAANERE
ncbi:MAG: M81 family metallopeptidase [Armatimonadetes bacterium]|nr:M81 family metallopeptidase [Armatimonadota bacterium]